MDKEDIEKILNETKRWHEDLLDKMKEWTNDIQNSFNKGISRTLGYVENNLTETHNDINKLEMRLDALEIKINFIVNNFIVNKE